MDAVCLAVPDATITPASAEVNWSLRLKSSVIEESKIYLMVARRIKMGYVDSASDPITIHTLEGSHLFRNLQPDILLTLLH